jgi:hypothetical protein
MTAKSAKEASLCVNLMVRSMNSCGMFLRIIEHNKTE